MNELCLQEVADLFGCYACVNKYEEDRILLFDRHPYYNKDSGTYGGRCIGWVSNVANDTIPRVVVPRCKKLAEHSGCHPGHRAGADSALQPGGNYLRHHHHQEPVVRHWC